MTIKKGVFISAQDIEKLTRRIDNLEKGLVLALKTVRALIEKGEGEVPIKIREKIKEILGNIDEKNKRPLGIEK